MNGTKAENKMQATEQDVLEYLALGDRDFKAIYECFAIVDRSADSVELDPKVFLSFLRHIHDNNSPSVNNFREWVRKKYQPKHIRRPTRIR